MTHDVIEDDNKLIAIRREKLAQLREQGNAFPNDFKREHFAADLQAQYGEHDKQSLQDLNLSISVAGRIMLNRGAFMVIQDMSGRIQLYVNRQTLSPEMLETMKHWDLGDIIGARGLLHKSNKGDLYVDLQFCQLLTKSLRPLPEKFQGLKDIESKYRQRYVDLIVNADTQRVFALRSKLIEALRGFLLERRFLEVETPMMHAIPGGASAKPFNTHHNALDMPLFLRIAPELYLKRLVVGGFERVFEINRNFRNEGLSTRHNPEFTMVEFYQAYADYHDMMDLTEQMFKHLAHHLMGSGQLTYQERVYDFDKPFARMTVKQALQHYDAELKAIDVDNREALMQFAKQHKIAIESSWGLGRLHMAIFEERIETQLLDPVFITEYPTEVSPLARQNDHNPEITDRFELFIAGRELANGFSELNDSEDQAARFHQQVENKNAGDDEAMHFDADYIHALEYGLPPTAGEGIGIDRLVMLFADAPSIRDVILFPLMRPV
jgi:lysyl-tRNA synthetase class 2